ncbi:MAG: hypothetical protein A3G49_00110 [Candidatus Sungbacteria bacterium RIFCSPLOWO2_12_FULL_41_11]|uniref:Glycosyltransferase RgtA/B/C/D-like domain-containing protein n=1 Tax=Candidatus Sungbacteria bacterium RIFCSPLOWO2_12_FULL_41_11 TaxID=1802286 RepID=A0A1G2LMB7_9BACT|nr:MAG: hypothetical protein UV01_C0005G0031 [Parcubacteria group bacterium GW2011_GWA2_42_14]OGZ99778.1 MAG: hypothetical protein A3D41_04415 [Candidatus Sungbacteria bacterium RIFCSPHIGHO2_02_FULL_41_12b]OHA12664.1 MAG: hypothetical protein A3G49_00110 [Candidatus Sungbacteria bacterium RIFCSPLOWO2_12_FULL_41_11]
MEIKRNRNTIYILAAIIFLAAVLRLWGIGAGDPVGDEVLYAFRAVGLLDYDVAEFQTTPLQWFDGNIPWWTKLSFHDHPPLVFLIQHFFIKIFGENIFAFRFSAALFGIASVYLIYKLGALLFSPLVGIISALILAVSSNHILISRVGLQEPYVIFFLLLFSYALVRSLKNDNFLWLVGLSMGLGFLTKYTLIFITVPVLFIYFIIFRREYFWNKKFWMNIILAILIFSPVLIYNFGLYRAVGHFDFQFSYIFGQHPEVWKTAPGKEEAGTILDRIRNFLPNLIQSNSWLFLLMSFLGLSALFKSRFLLVSLVFLVFLIAGFIGPQMRFLSMLVPFLALGIGFLIYSVYQQFPKLKTTIIYFFAAFIIFEIVYSVNSQLIYASKGPSPWFYSQKLRYENYNWGFAELGKYLDRELSGKMPAFVFDARYKFIEALQAKTVALRKQKGAEPYPALIIYDGNMLNGPQIWYLDRLQIYHGWPVLKTEDYQSFLAQNGQDYFTKAGFNYFYFIAMTQNVPLKKPERLTETGGLFEKELLSRGYSSVFLYNKKGIEVFRIYKF